MEQEIWRQIEGFENYYISNMGRVKNIAYRGQQKEIERKIWGNNEIQLSNHGKRKNFKIHKLVAMYFVANPNNYNGVDFIDGDANNFKASNLIWVKKRRISKTPTKTSIAKQQLWENRKKILARIDREVIAELYTDMF